MSERIYIYKIYFPQSDKCYIGQTKDIKRRMRVHLLHAKSAIHDALQKYDDWIISVLDICESRDEANKVEIEKIREYKAMSPDGYNLTAGGDVGALSDETRKRIGDAHRGKLVSEETRRKLSEAHQGQMHTPESIEKALATRIKNGKLYHSEESKEKIRRLATGRRHTEETKAKLRDIAASPKMKALQRELKLGRNNPAYGKHPSQETRKKLSDARTGEKNPFYGMQHAEETKEKNRKSHLGVKLSASTIKKRTISNYRNRIKKLTEELLAAGVGENLVLEA